MAQTTLQSSFKSPLHEMTQTTPTCLWNDSASISELTYSIENGAVGATCNPVIVVGVLRKEVAHWAPVLGRLIEDNPTATEDQLGWRLTEEVSKNAAALFSYRSSTRRAAGTAGCPSKPTLAFTATPRLLSPRRCGSAS